jgi:hypothetical protein
MTMTASRTAFAGLFVLMTTLAVSACASGGPRTPDKTYAQLSAECEARGGVLAPTGRVTGREALDNVCRITGGPSERLQPRN